MDFKKILTSFNDFMIFLLKCLKLREERNDSYLKYLSSDRNQTKLYWLDILLFFFLYIV